jgi:hypothetical protein
MPAPCAGTPPQPRPAQNGQHDETHHLRRHRRYRDMPHPSRRLRPAIRSQRSSATQPASPADTGNRDRHRPKRNSPYPAVSTPCGLAGSEPSANPGFIRQSGSALREAPHALQGVRGHQSWLLLERADRKERPSEGEPDHIGGSVVPAECRQHQRYPSRGMHETRGVVVHAYRQDDK